MRAGGVRNVRGKPVNVSHGRIQVSCVVPTPATAFSSSQGPSQLRRIRNSEERLWSNGSESSGAVDSERLPPIPRVSEDYIRRVNEHDI